MSLVGFGSRNHPQQVAVKGANPKVDDRATPPELFDPLHERFRFTLDACALPHNAKLRRFFAPDDFYEPNVSTETRTPLARDGLAQSWSGERRVWCNPPYSSIEPWVVKAWNSTAELVVMLVPANRTEQGWWQRRVEPYRDRGEGFRTEFIARRQRFIAHDADGIKPNERPPFGVVLLIWGGTSESTGAVQGRTDEPTTAASPRLSGATSHDPAPAPFQGEAHNPDAESVAGVSGVGEEQG